MDRRFCWLLLSVFGAGCGSTAAQADRSPALIRCLERHGGKQVTQPAQLARVPSTDPRYGTSFLLDSIQFESLDVDAGNDDARQALVLVEHPQPTKPRTLSAVEALQRAGREDLATTLLQRGTITDKLVAMVVMPASTQHDGPLSSCAEEVAGEEISVP